MKRCTKCGVEKPEEAFEFQPSKGKLRTECRECRRIWQKEWTAKRRANPPQPKQETKRCKRCQEVKPVSEFSLRAPGYFHSQCKACKRAIHQEKRREQYRNNPTEHFHRPFENEAGIIVKRCTHCHTEKPLSEFSTNGKHGQHGKCKECEKTLQKARYDANPEKYREAVMKSARRHPDRVHARTRRWESANRKRRTQYQRDLKAAHPERFHAYYQLRKSRLTYEDRHRWYMNGLERSLAWRKANKERIRENDRKWRQVHPEKHVASQHRRRARKKSIPGMYTVVQIQEQLKRQRYRCYYAACGHAKFKRVKGKYVYHIDHTFPLSRVAGTDVPANDISYLVLTCPTCNLSKHDKFPWEWPEGGRLL